MKQLIMNNYIKIFIFVFTCGFLFCSCESDSHDPAFVLTDSNFNQYVPKVPAYWIGQSSVGSATSGSQKETWIEFDLELKPLFNSTFWGIKIDKVVFLFDGEEISTKFKAPYTVKYSVNNPSYGIHTLKADIHVSSKTLSPHIITHRYDFNNKY